MKLRFSTAIRPLLQVRIPPLSRKFPCHTAGLSTVGRPAQSRPIGQPTHETHPHLLLSGEITPGISSIEYALRRAQLAAKLPESSIAIIPSAHLKYRSGPVFHEFHQHPDFYYLTGFLEPDSICIIEKTGSTNDGKHIFHMIVREKDPKAELWDGSRAGLEGAQEIFNADRSWNISRVGQYLAPLIEKVQFVFTSSGAITSSSSPLFPPKEGSFLEKMITDQTVVPIESIMHELRVVKSGAEASVMRQAGRISGRSFNRAMGQHFSTEKSLYNFLEYDFRTGGCEKSAYVPVVAGGTNALSIHYTSNDNRLRDGDLVLVDAGGQYGGYAADITRTWPVNGKFTAAQRDLYQCVLDVQKKCVALCRESMANSLDDIHKIAEDSLRSELRHLGFETRGRYLETLFPHHVGHYVGVDLHDCGTFGRSHKLVSGHVVTIEPGVYVPDDEQWPAHFRGIGIRIEDTVYVGKENPIVLSVEAAKEVEDIEALRLNQ